MRPRARRATATLRSGIAAGIALVALVGAAGPAAADPPRPTDYRSTITAVEPEGPFDARVVGGDAFLELEVDDGHEVTVAGYGDEPYLRFLPDGTVERNRRSEATYLNEDRKGAIDLPAAADNEAEPEWEVVAEDGTYAWHDHRIHWMGSGTPPGAEPGQLVQEWTVELTVDGTPTAIQGELVMADEISPVPWMLLIVAGAGLVVAAGRRRPAPAATAAALAAAIGALAIGWGQYASAPAGAGADLLLVAVPVVGLLAAIVGVARRGTTLGSTAVLAATAAVLGWCALRASVLWKPVLPTDLAFGLDRGVTALALGLSLAAAGLIVWSGGLVALPAVPAAEVAADRPGRRHRRGGGSR